MSIRTLKTYIYRACDSTLFEPNLALDLEIADLINQKKGTYPREAASFLLHFINSSDQHVAILALALLDILVKNCGYAFHLQIASKEFLNELVRRFPERPLARPSRAQYRILELLEEWKSTICVNSRYKDDLGHIRDMHRLLTYKGYKFPEAKSDSLAVLNPSENLKSADELEEEERAGKQAKLQELIRRGTPQDLADANELMKELAGYKNQVDYRAKAAEDVERVRQKANMLIEMMAGVKDGDVIGQADAFDELANAVKNAQPKIQKMVQEESDDAEAVVKLLELNDFLNNTATKYDAMKRGDWETARSINVHQLGTPPARAGGASPAAGAAPASNAQSLSLIDFDFDAPAATPAAAPQPAQTGSSAADDLLGDLASLSVQTPYGHGGNISLGAPSAPSSPPPQTQGTNNYSALDDLLGGGSSHSRNASSSSAGAFGAFGSSAPAPAAAPVSEVTINDSAALSVRMEVSRVGPAPDAPILLTAKFNNKSPQPVTDLVYQMAVPKSMVLKMQPASGVQLAPMQQNGITQVSQITGVPRGSAGVKLRWRVSYKVGGRPVEESGEATNLPVV